MSCKSNKNRKAKRKGGSCGGGDRGCGCGCRCGCHRRCDCGGGGCSCGGRKKGGKGQGGCHGGGLGSARRGFKRHILTKAEKLAARVARLERYLAELEAEAAAVRERLAEIKTNDDPGSN